MKTMKTNLTQKIRGFILLPFLVLTMMLVYSLNMQSSESKNKTEITQLEKITVKGKVLDNNNDGVDGVLVKDKNSDIETETNGVGSFTIVLNEPTTVHFIKLGFQALELEIAESDSNLVVMIIPESNEMIVEGFDIEKKANKDTQWKLDSLSSITDNYPLYIIDEKQKENDFDIKMLNAEDILSIEILKDSIAKGVYGVDGEKGAVKITTKNYNDLKIDNQNQMHINKSDTARTILKDKYEIYKDTMNARNKKVWDKKMKEPVDTTSLFKGQKGREEWTDPKDTSRFKGTLEKKELKNDTTKSLLKNIEEVQ